MKHLKTYQIFENIDTIIKDFQEILLELSDKGFNIQVKKGEHHVYRKCIEITISKDGGDFYFWTERNIGKLTPFNFIEVKDELIRLLSYAKSESWYDFNFEIITPEDTLQGTKFNDVYKASVEVEGDEIVVPDLYFSTEKKEPISDDVEILCIYIGLGK